MKSDPPQWRLSEAGRVHAMDSLGEGAEDGQTLALPEHAGPEEYVKIALVHNPKIAAAQAQVTAAQAQVVMSRELDDPMFMISPVGYMGGMDGERTVLMTSISQLLPTPGKLETREQIARQDVAMAQAELESMRLEVSAETRKAYWQYEVAVRSREVIALDRTLMEQFHQAAQARYESGLATQQDVLRASVELSNLDNQLITLSQQETTARAMLNQLLDREVSAAVPEPAEIKPVEMALGLNALLEQAAQHNPALRKIRAGIEAQRRQLELARLNRWPDLTLSASYNAMTNSDSMMEARARDQWWLGLGINLPIWTDAHDAEERQALAGLMAQVADLTSEQNSLAFSVQEAMSRVETQQRLMQLLLEVIVPQARQTVDASAAGYRAGNVDFLTLVDNWRQLLNYELLYREDLAQYEMALADLRQVLGGELPATAEGKSTQQIDSKTDSNTQLRRSGHDQ